jgi:RAP1 GTPase activating protein 1
MQFGGHLADRFSLLSHFLFMEQVCSMLALLENYYWRYTSASELVNMILLFIETRAYQVFQCPDFLSLSESIVQMIMARNLEVPEVRKFEAMLQWAKHKIRTRGAASRIDAKIEFRCTMERLTRDLRLYRISPQDLIKVAHPFPILMETTRKKFHFASKNSLFLEICVWREVERKQ